MNPKNTKLNEKYAQSIVQLKQSMIHSNKGSLSGSQVITDSRHYSAMTYKQVRVESSNDPAAEMLLQKSETLMSAGFNNAEDNLK